MKGNEPKETNNVQVEVNASLNVYAGQDISPKKTEHINNVAEHIKRAIKKLQLETAPR